MGKRGDLQRKRVAAVVSGYYILVIVLLVILAQANIFLPKHSFAVFGLAFIFIPSFLYYLYTIQALVVTDEKRSRSNNNNHTSSKLLADSGDEGSPLGDMPCGLWGE